MFSLLLAARSQAHGVEHGYLLGVGIHSYGCGGNSEKLRLCIQRADSYFGGYIRLQRPSVAYPSNPWVEIASRRGRLYSGSTGAILETFADWCHRCEKGI